MTTKKEKLQQYKKLIILLAKIAFQYSDLITDMMLVLTILDISEEKQKNSGVATTDINSLMSADLLILFMALERFISFHDLISLLKHQKKKQKSQANLSKNNNLKDDQQENINESLLEKLKKYLLALLLVSTYLDYLYVLVYEYRYEVERVNKKQMIDHFCENIVFFDVSIAVIEYQYIETKELDGMVFLSMFLSCASCCYVLFKAYNNRARLQAKYKDKEDVKFSQLDLDTKKFIAYPYTISYHKLFAPEIPDHPQLLKESYLLKQELDKQKNIPEELFIEYKKLNQNHEKSFLLNILEKLILIINLFVSILGFCLLDMTHGWSLNAFTLNHTFLLGFTTFFPQLAIHFYLQIKDVLQKKNIKLLIKTIFKELLQALFVPLMGVIIFLTPTKSEDIPLLRKTKENWITNFFGSTYIILLKIGYQVKCIFDIQPMVFQGKDIAYQGFYEEGKIDRFTSDDSLILYFYHIGLYLFYAQLVFNFFYYLEYLYYNFVSKDKFDKKDKIYLEKLQNILNIIKQKQEDVEEIKKEQSKKDTEPSPVKINNIPPQINKLQLQFEQFETSQLALQHLEQNSIRASANMPYNSIDRKLSSTIIYQQEQSKNASLINTSRNILNSDYIFTPKVTRSFFQQSTPTTNLDQLIINNDSPKKQPCQ